MSGIDDYDEAADIGGCYLVASAVLHARHIQRRRLSDDEIRRAAQGWHPIADDRTKSESLK